MYIWKPQICFNVDTKRLNVALPKWASLPNDMGFFKFIYLLFILPFYMIDFLLQSFKNETFEVSMGLVIWFDGLAAGLPNCSVKEDQYLFSPLVAGKELADPVQLSLPSSNFQITLWCDMEIKDLWFLTCPCRLGTILNFWVFLYECHCQSWSSTLQNSLIVTWQATVMGCFLHLCLSKNSLSVQLCIAHHWPSCATTSLRWKMTEQDSVAGVFFSALGL